MVVQNPFLRGLIGQRSNHTQIGLTLTVIVSVGLLRPLKGIMRAAQFSNRAAEACADD